MTALTPVQQTVLRDLSDACAGVQGISAVALGGSHARGRARPDSDLDITLLYRRSAPFNVNAIRNLADTFNDTPSATVSSFGEWGKWVDGGAWLTVGGIRADLLYRSVEQVEDTWRAACEGQYELDYGQQHPFGYFGPTLLGETIIALPLHDNHAELARLKSMVTHYPEPLRGRVVQTSLWDAEFGLNAFAPKFAATGNAYGAAGCFARAGHRMVLALFALNRVWLLNDKTALDEIDDFAMAPEGFSRDLQHLLGQTGESVSELEHSLTRIRELLASTAALAGELYRPTWTY